MRFFLFFEKFRCCGVNDLADWSEENELFGEMGVIEDTLRSAGARCMTDCVVISLSKQEYEKKLNESDPFIKGLLRLLSIRLREMTKPKTLGSK